MSHYAASFVIQNPTCDYITSLTSSDTIKILCEQSIFSDTLLLPLQKLMQVAASTVGSMPASLPSLPGQTVEKRFFLPFDALYPEVGI